MKSSAVAGLGVVYKGKDADLHPFHHSAKLLPEELCPSG